MSDLLNPTRLSALPPLLASAAGSQKSGDGGLGLFLGGIGILAFLLIALVIMISLHKKHRFSLFCGLLALLFSGGAMLLCLLASTVGTLVARPTGDPQETVTAFFDALSAGDYDSAYARLNGYSDLGLANTPADPVGQKLYDALKESYSYELYGSCVVDQLSAHQEVLFTYLDLPALAADLEEETMEVLSGFVEERPRSELYDKDNNYLPEVAQEAYSTAVDNLLAQAGNYYTTTGVQLELDYMDGSWLLQPSRSLLTAITGGAA